LELFGLETTTVRTTATVPDQGTMLVGGLVQLESSGAVSGVPLLSSIPVLGRLTRSEKEEHIRSNLVFIVRTEILELED